VLTKNVWWAKRVAMLPVHLFVVAVAVFFLVRLVPGDPAIQITGGQASEEQLDQVRESLGLNGSVLEQLGSFLGNVVTGDLGTSIQTGQPVLNDIGARLPQTLELSLMALVLATLLAVVLSGVAVFAPRNPLAAVARAYARAAGALPDFCMGIIAILVFYVVLRVAPAPIGRLNGRESAPPAVTHFPFLDTLINGDPALVRSAAAHLVLPVAAMTVAYAPYLMKQLILGLEREVDAGSTRFRIAAGAGRAMVIVSVFRRAFPAVVVVTGSLLGGMLGGAVVMESMFGLGGIGQYAVNAVVTSDFPAMQGVLISMVAVVLVVFLVVDVVTMVLDPRRRTA
jgi:ABC-type dipeptide/oligopeptide/nickel transport system permease component